MTFGELVGAIVLGYILGVAGRNGIVMFLEWILRKAGRL